MVAAAVGLFAVRAGSRVWQAHGSGCCCCGAGSRGECCGEAAERRVACSAWTALAVAAVTAVCQKAVAGFSALVSGCCQAFGGSVSLSGANALHSQAQLKRNIVFTVYILISVWLAMCTCECIPLHIDTEHCEPAVISHQIVLTIGRSLTPYRS